MVLKTYSIPGMTGTGESATGQIITTAGYGDRGQQWTETKFPWKDNSWTQEEHNVQGDVINGEYRNSAGNLLWKFKDYPTGAGNFNHACYAPNPQDRYTYTQAIANSHPGQPAVELPNFLFELKDVPDMLKHAYERGKLLEEAAGGTSKKAINKYMSNPKNPAKDWLNYNFGWRPFMSDMQDIAKVSRATYRGQKHARSAAVYGTSRKRYLGFTTNHGVNSTYYNGTVRHDGIRMTRYTRERWIVSKWLLLPHYFPSFESDYSAHLYRQLGLEPSISQIWNAVPWSWLVDWFTDVGNLISTYSNRYGWVFKSAQIMMHDKALTTVTPKLWPGLATAQGGPFTVTSEYKNRGWAVPSATPTKIFQNFLSESQLATLASLKVTKAI